MSRIPALLLLLGAAFGAAPLCSASAEPSSAPVEALVRAYPDHLDRIEGNVLIWRDGTRMPASDGVAHKDFDALLNHPDIKDMFAITYRPGPPDRKPSIDEDPGRIRYEPFFRKMYGDCRKGEVEKHLRTVRWMPSRGGGSVRVTTVNQVADRLEAVIRDLEKLPVELTRYLVPSAGAFSCRNIAGTGLNSMHSYAAAIDIGTKFADYWRWAKPRNGTIPYGNRIPFAIVEAFERHGFIWGGKWYHYDTMHFEYRPELLAKPP